MLEIIIRVSGIIFSSGIVIAIFNIFLEKRKSKNKISERLTLDIIENIFSPTLLKKKYEEAEARKQVQYFRETLQNSIYSSYLFELLHDSIELDNINESNSDEFRDLYYRFRQRYFETLISLRKQTGMSVGKEQTKEARKLRFEAYGLYMTLPAIILAIISGKVPYDKLFIGATTSISTALLFIGILTWAIAKAGEEVWGLLVIIVRFIKKIVLSIYYRIKKYLIK